MSCITENLKNGLITFYLNDWEEKSVELVNLKK